MYECTDFLDFIFRDKPPVAEPVFACGGHTRGNWKPYLQSTFEFYAETVPEQDYYYTTSSYYKNEHGGYRNQQNQFAAYHVLVLDDIGTKVEPNELTPTYKIETSPGSYQWGYVLKNAITDYELASRFINAVRLSERKLTDRGGQMLNKFVRLPTGINGKPTNTGGFEVKLVEWNAGLVYSYDDLLVAWGLSLGDATKPYEPNDVTPEEDPYYQALLRLKMVKGPVKDSKGCVDIVCPWEHKHTTDIHTGTAYGLGQWFKCHHDNCFHKTFEDVRVWMQEEKGIDIGDLDIKTEALEFEDLDKVEGEVSPPDEVVPWDDGLFNLPRNPAEFPTRPWIIEGRLLRGAVTINAAPGGTGKSLFELLTALAVCEGRSDWLGEDIKDKGNVWVINNEEPKDELMRRFMALCYEYGKDPRDYRGKVLLSSGYAKSFIFADKAKRNDDRVVAQGKIINWVMEHIERYNIKVIAVDPIVSTHRLDENSAPQAEQYMAIWRRIAEKANVAVSLASHVNKASGVGGSEAHAGSMSALRGSSAVAAAARIVYTLAGMSEKTAGKYGFSKQDQIRLVRFDYAKGNYTLIGDDIKWFRKVSHTLPNGEKTGVFKLDEAAGIQYKMAIAEKESEK